MLKESPEGHQEALEETKEAVENKVENPFEKKISGKNFIARNK